jgi:hypothetical protein
MRILLPSLAAAALTVAMGITAPNQASAQVIPAHWGYGGGGYGYGYRYAPPPPPPPPPVYGYGYGYRPWHHHRDWDDRPYYAPRPYGYGYGRW